MVFAGDYEGGTTLEQSARVIPPTAIPTLLPLQQPGTLFAVHATDDLSTAPVVPTGWGNRSSVRFGDDNLTICQLDYTVGNRLPNAWSSTSTSDKNLITFNVLGTTTTDTVIEHRGPVWDGSTQSWVLTSPSNTVTAAEAPANADATIGYPDNYLICDRTGFRVSVKEGLVEEWNGLRVRRQSYESRHAQDFVRGVDEQLTESERPEQTDRFLETNEVSASDL